MARIATIGIAALVLGLGVGAARAQTPCAGDCSGDNTVVIGELITCVNIALGSSPTSSCTACDGNSDGMVSIGELIAAVNVALGTTSCGSGGARCGNGPPGHPEAGEECDDGNNVGGDGCAANCTIEVRRETDLDPTKSISTIQITALAITLNVSGHQALTAGKARNEAVMGPDGQQLFAPGEIPIVIKTADVQFDPIPINGLFCACVKGVDVPEFGDHVSGTGVLGCGPQGLTDVNFKVEQDHDTTPGSPGNSGFSGPGTGLPDDPECNAHSDGGGGLVSDACVEGTGAMCSGPGSEHLGVCNSPRVYTFFGGQAPRGSVLLRTNTANTVLANGSSTPCEATIKNGICKNQDGNPVPEFGDDCLPCTADDAPAQPVTPQISPTTSGTAEVIIYDTADQAGAKLGEGATCGGTPCKGKVEGKLADCDALINDPNAPLTGALVTASPQLDNATSGDLVLTTTLEGKTP